MWTFREAVRAHKGALKHLLEATCLGGVLGFCQNVFAHTVYRVLVYVISDTVWWLFVALSSEAAHGGQYFVWRWWLLLARWRRFVSRASRGGVCQSRL